VFLHSLRFEDAVALGVAPESGLPETAHLAAVSGGADSVAMLVALVALRERWQGFDLRCIHVEHGIRPKDESRGDADFARSLCEKFRVPCRVVSVKPGKVAETAKKRGIGIEAAARLYRHRAWFREAARIEAEGRGPARILVAHTADDMLETALMRVFRGAGPSGLAAMPASRGRILRPLLALTRQDVLSYLAEKQIRWREDSTNADTRYLRNRVRHRLIPVLDENFPQWRAALSSLAETQSLVADFIVGEANSRVKWRPAPGALLADEDAFFAQPAIVREEALFQGVDALLAGSGSGPGLTREVRRANVRRFARGGETADLGRAHLRRKNGAVVVSRGKRGAGRGSGCECGFSLLIIAPGFYNLKGIALEVREGLPSHDEGGAAFSALLPLALRPAFKEDRIGRTEEAVSAVDSLGIAAFIGKDGLLQRRHGAPQPAHGSFCSVIVRVEGVKKA